MLGAAGAPHCAAMCGPASASVLRGCSRHAPHASPLAFHLARVAGYATAGAVAASSVGALAQLGQLSPVLRPLWTLLHCAALGLGLWLLWQGRQPAWLESLGRSASRLAPQQQAARRLAAHARADAGRFGRAAVGGLALWLVAVGAGGVGAGQHGLGRGRGDGRLWPGQCSGPDAGAMGFCAPVGRSAPVRCRSMPGRCVWPVQRWPQPRPGRSGTICSSRVVAYCLG